MAAPAFNNVKTTGWQTGTSTDVTKPTGLAVGDLMIAVVSSALSAMGLPSGFTALGTQGDGLVDSGQQSVSVGYKIADAGDVAASSFNFAGSSCLNFCAVMRITGASASAGSYKYFGNSAANTATPAFSSGLTPTNYGDSTLLLAFFTQRAATTGSSTYAIVTSNPSWSEGYDVANGTTTNASFAYATRPEVTATGGTTDWAGQLVSIPVPFSISKSETVTGSDSAKESFTHNVSDTTTSTDSETLSPNRIRNQAKNTATVTNVDKNNATVTNQAKNVVSVTNQPKS